MGTPRAFRGSCEQVMRSKSINLSVAARAGIPRKFAASCHGSTSSRAIAERTLSDIPFRSSPIGANRKELNLEFRSNEVLADAMGATGFLNLAEVFDRIPQRPGNCGLDPTLK